jgi:hypothetical protein
MRFLLTIYDVEGRFESQSEEEMKAEIDAYWALDREAREHGVFVDSAPLHPTATAKTLRERDGHIQISDGPFAETKEQLGGYYLLDCASTHEALEWAAKVPAARCGSVEVREVLDMGPPPGEAGDAREVARSA